jgi:L-alanine-DL-glutamate epimerase-like enolase superfamily enzyme
MPKERIAEMAWLTQRTNIPTIADESFKRIDDLKIIGEAFTGINIKLMKCTGITEAVKIMNLAREMGLKINLGCMTESSCAISAAAQLSSRADWIDLDGPLLIKNNPFRGISYSKGKIQISNGCGIAAIPDSELHFN